MLRHKVWSDLWRHKSRTVTAVLSIAMGLFTLGGIFGLFDLLLSSMDAAHLAATPSHISMILRGAVNDAQVETLYEIDGVAQIDPISQFPVRYRVGPDAELAIATLFVRPDYDQQGLEITTLVDGRFPDESGLAVERLTSPYYGVRPDDEVTLAVLGNEIELPVSGVVRHPFVEPPNFGGQPIFFASAATLAEIGYPEGQYNQLLVTIDSFSQQRAQTIAADLREALNDQGQDVLVTLYQEPDQHWGRRFVEGITLILRVMAILALVMSVVLIFAIFQAIMAQQIDRIGIMKAIGVPYWAIVGTYLSQALLMGLLALLLSLIPTLLFASLLSAWFLNLFNITGLGFQWSAQALWLQIGAALLIPLLATLRPVLQGSRVTVRAALASQGLGAGFQAAPWAIRLSRLLFRSPSRAAAFSNLFRRRERLWLTLTSLTTAGVMFLIVMALISSVNLTLDNEAARQQYDIRFGLAGLHADSELLETVAPILTDEGTGPTGQAQVWYARSASMTLAETRIEDTAGLGMRLIAIELNEAGDTASLYTPAIVAGRWLQPNDNEQYHVVISAETADRNGIELGDAINLDLGVVGSSLFTVVGTYRTVYGGGFVSEPIYIPRQTLLSWLDREPEGTVLLIQANLPTLADAVAMADEAESLLDEAGIVVDPYVTEIKLEERAFADNQFASITSMLLSLAGMAATVGGIGLAGTLSINVLERTREIGILRSLGANDWAIYSSFVLESLLQGILSWLIAVPLAWLAAPALARLMGQTLIDLDLDFRFDWLATGIWLLTILIIAILAALLPARNAARIKVRDSLAYS